MQFLGYWELNENMSSADRLKIADNLMSKGLFPPQGVNIVRWDATPDLWGTLIIEADNAEDVFRALELWRGSGAGFFKFTKIAPMVPVQDVIPIAQEIQQALS